MLAAKKLRIQCQAGLVIQAGNVEFRVVSDKRGNMQVELHAPSGTPVSVATPRRFGLNCRKRKRKT